MLRRLSIVSLLAAGALFGVAASQAAQPDRSTLPWERAGVGKLEEL